MKVALLILAACHGGGVAHDAHPLLTSALVVPNAKGLVVGTSTLDDVKKAFPDVTTNTDKSLGGSGMVDFNGAKGTSFDTAGAHGFVTLEDGAQVLSSLEISAREPLCESIVKTFDALPGAKDCGNGRKTGASTGVYCATTGKRQISIDCMRNDDGTAIVHYSLDKQR